MIENISTNSNGSIATDSIQNSTNRATVAIHTQGPGKYLSQMFCYSTNNIRFSSIRFEEANPIQIPTSLTFKVPARKSFPRVPIANNSDEPWTLNVVIEG